MKWWWWLCNNKELLLLKADKFSSEAPFYHLFLSPTPVCKVSPLGYFTIAWMSLLQMEYVSLQSKRPLDLHCCSTPPLLVKKCLVPSYPRLYLQSPPWLCSPCYPPRLRHQRGVLFKHTQVQLEELETTSFALRGYQGIKSVGDTRDLVWEHWPPDSVGNPVVPVVSPALGATTSQVLCFIGCESQNLLLWNLSSPLGFGQVPLNMYHAPLSD